MFLTATEQDVKEAAAIARRRASEEERKKRIFNPHQRIHGIDYEALKLQMEEKKIRLQKECQANEVYEQEMARQNLLAAEFEQRIKEDKRRIIRELGLYREIHQRFDDRREFDLNDPDLLKKSIPARLHDDDIRCGPSSLQRFDGEDLMTPERRKAQKEQRCTWMDIQMQENKKAAESTRQANEQYEQSLRDMDLRSCALLNAQRQASRQLNIAHAQFNQAMATETQQRRLYERELNNNAAKAHNINMINSELLSETTDVTSVLGPHRVLRDRHKGFGKEKYALMYEERDRQIQEKLDRKCTELQQDAAWARVNRRHAIAGVLMDRELANLRRDVRSQTQMTNRELSREQFLRQEYLNKILYSQTPTTEFYDQFNTTTR